LRPPIALPIAGIAKFNSRHQAQLRRSGCAQYCEPGTTRLYFPSICSISFYLEAVGNQFAAHSIIVDQQKVRVCGVAAAA
jgi:hypothetical protein